MNSIRVRLLLISGLVLLAFVLITGFALQKANETTALQAQQERMQGLVYALLGAIEIDGDAFQLNTGEVPEPRLSTPGSGLEARVVDGEGAVAWQSASALDTEQVAAGLVPGQWAFEKDQDRGRFETGFGFRWLAESGSPQFTIRVSESMQDFLERKAIFQRKLWLWLLVPAGLLLVVQLAVLARVMRPLKQLATEIHEIEQGQGNQVDGRYPRELHPLQGALNTLLHQERGRRERYRQSLEDLAHSLKTPLAVIRNLVHADGTDAGREVSEQAVRMQEIISRQLGRAAGQGRSLLAAPVGLREPLEAVIRSLKKVYADKGLEFSLDLQEELAVRIDRADLFDVLGNLLDNACKWATGKIAVTGRQMDGFVEIRIRDDGPGFPEEAARLLERGLRADSRQEGQGLGLAVVNEIVTAAGGSVELVSDAGEGACVCVTLPT